MHGILQAAERQLDLAADPEDVDFRQVVVGVSKLEPNALERLHKADAALSKVDSATALDRIGY